MRICLRLSPTQEDGRKKQKRKEKEDAVGDEWRAG